MKRKSRVLFAVLLIGILAVMSACGGKDKKEEVKTESAAAETVTPTPTAAPTETPTPAPTEKPAPEEEKPEAETETSASETEEAGENAEEAEPAEAEPAAPAASGDLPVVTADPTDETVTEGNSCLYIASADKADSMEWYAVSPDGSIDIPYTKINEHFPYLEYAVDEDEDALALYNIPADFDGWGSYCRFKNSAGTVNSGTAYTYVKAVETEEAEEAEE